MGYAYIVHKSAAISSEQFKNRTCVLPIPNPFNYWPKYLESHVISDVPHGVCCAHWHGCRVVKAFLSFFAGFSVHKTLQFSPRSTSLETSLEGMMVPNAEL